MKFIAPSPLNGQTLKNELTEVGILVDKIVMDGDGDLVFDIKSTEKNKVQQVLNQHKGEDIVLEKELLKQSAISKLKVLGLTEAEVLAFLG